MRLLATICFVLVFLGVQAGGGAGAYPLMPFGLSLWCGGAYPLLPVGLALWCGSTLV